MAHRLRAWAIETAGALTTKQRNQELKLHSQILWNSHRRATDNQYRNGSPSPSPSLSNEWRAFEWHQSQPSLDETDIRDRKCSASIIIISSTSSSSSSSSYLSSRSSNKSVIVLVKLMHHYLQSSLLDRDDCLNLVDGTNTITDTKERSRSILILVIISIFLSLVCYCIKERYR